SIMCFFFFQAEDGIRVLIVTGVQTCALPIYLRRRPASWSPARVGIPTAVLATMKRAADEGVLVKGPRTLEALARIDTVVFDKTEIGRASGRGRGANPEVDGAARGRQESSGNE